LEDEMAVERLVESPVGALKLVAEDGALTVLHLNAERGPTRGRTRAEDERVLDWAASELAEYFAGKRTVFTIPLAPRGTPFQRAVWNALTGIPFGETRSYLEIAKRVGKPSATRAVGHANGRNPIAIVIPCHRVIGANGTLTGFGGGLPMKRWLLDHEADCSGAGLPLRPRSATPA
jgi:methylated-DNA-[protein]-cysteine S-methyltransferase